MPSISKPIKIKILSGKKGQAITIRDRNDNQNVINTTLGATAQAGVDLQNFKNGYTPGHVIDFIVGGEVVGQNSLTTSGDAPQTVTISTSSVTTGIARGI